MATPTRREWEPHRSTRHSTRNPRHLDDDAKRAKSKIGLAINRMKKRLAELHFGAVRNVTRRILSGGALFKLHSKVAHEARVTSLGVLTASIAHEVDQPLAAIVISGQFSLRLLAQTEPDIDKVREVTGRMISDARRASEIIDRMLAMTTRRTPEREPLSLRGDPGIDSLLPSRAPVEGNFDCVRTCARTPSGCWRSYAAPTSDRQSDHQRYPGDGAVGGPAPDHSHSNPAPERSNGVLRGRG